MFLQVIFDFTIVAMIVFLMVRFLTKLKNIVLKEETQISIPQPSASETLLAEIRDELKQLRVQSLSNSQKLNS
jgi:large conductance mechanosensitive channel